MIGLILGGVAAVVAWQRRNQEPPVDGAPPPGDGPPPPGDESPPAPSPVATPAADEDLGSLVADRPVGEPPPPGSPDSPTEVFRPDSEPPSRNPPGQAER